MVLLNKYIWPSITLKILNLKDIKLIRKELIRDQLRQQLKL